MFISFKNNIYKTIFVTLFLTLFGCSNSTDNVEDNVWPDNVPNTALWVGGADGGIYLIIKKNASDNPDIYNGVIYYSSGGIDYEGKLSINNIENPSFDYKNSNSYSSWDGDTLYLRDGRELNIISK